MSDQVQQVLRHCRLFRDVPEALLFRLARFGRLIRLGKGQVILRPGQPCPGVFCVGSGLVEVYKLAPSGRQQTLRFAGPGATFGEVPVITSRPCPAYAACLEDVVCVLLPADQFVCLLEQDQALCLHLLRNLARRAEYLVGLIEDIALRDSCGRLASYLVRATAGADGLFELPVRKKDLASHLSLTKEALSRALRRLARAGLIEIVGRNRIRVLDPRLLRDVAEGLPVEELA